MTVKPICGPKRELYVAWSSKFWFRETGVRRKVGEVVLGERILTECQPPATSSALENRALKNEGVLNALGPF
jgi:hypothetical protein